MNLKKIIKKHKKQVKEFFYTLKNPPKYIQNKFVINRCMEIICVLLVRANDR